MIDATSRPEREGSPSHAATPQLRSVRPEEGGAGLHLDLEVYDAEVIADLAAVPAGPDRDRLTRQALRIGVLALRSARGQVDVASLRQEGERMVADLRGALDTHRSTLQERLDATVREWFDPQGGKLPERLRGMLGGDGELEQVLARTVGDEDSALVRRLRDHLGTESPLMKLLRPTEAEGLLHTLRTTVEGELSAQRKTILDQFSLDDRSSALSRLVAELHKQHGDFTQALEGRIDGVVKEFSLDEENSALRRLVDRVDAAQAKIQREFTLDDDASALARLRKELHRVLEDQEVRTRRFQQEVLASLSKMAGHREEAARGTQHGHSFEEALIERVQALGVGAGDIVTACGHETGAIRSCKVGDITVELGPDARAAGARIVLEAKADTSYSLVKARAEIETARKNRDAAVGIFVWSRKSAPTGFARLQRLDDDLFVVWDPDDPATDVVLESALLVARALVIRGRQDETEEGPDLEAFNRAILDIEKHAENLDQVERSVKTIENAAGKIRSRIGADQAAFARQVAHLRSVLESLRTS